MMIRARELGFARDLVNRLDDYQSCKHILPGINKCTRRDVLVAQIIDSTRRIRYVSEIRKRPISPRRGDPNDELFDPLKAALLFQEREEIDEAFWMVFLFVHFGKHHMYGWRYARRVYGRLGSTDRWDWRTVSSDPQAFSSWLHSRIHDVKGRSKPGGFGNHRKYQSLSACSSSGTGKAFETYVQWVDPTRGHLGLIDEALRQADSDPRKAFDILYRSMQSVASFGRLARFDYLTMLGKLGLSPIEPRHPYLHGSSGPLAGARLLFGTNKETTSLDQLAGDLATHLNIEMQAMEDALCNWQKSPENFIRFRGK